MPETAALSAPHSRWPAAYAAAMGLLLVVGAVIRWHNIGDYSLWLDELAQVTVARMDWPEFLAGVRSHTAAAPMDYLGTRLALGIFGFGTVWARLWPFLIGTATILLVERLTAELSGSRRAALAAAVLTVPAAFLVFYSQEARFYALAAATSVSAIWAFARAERLGRIRDWGAFALVSVAAIYTHYFYSVLFAGLGAWIVVATAIRWWRTDSASRTREAVRRLAPMLLVGAVVAVAFLPWYLYAARGQMAQVYDYPPIGDLSVDRLARWLLVLFSAGHRSASEGPDAWSDWTLLLAILGLAAAGAARLSWRRPVVVGAVVTYLMVLIPLAWAADQRAHYFVSERQFITLVPMALVLAGMGVAALLAATATVARRLVTAPGGRRAAVVAQSMVTAALLAVLAWGSATSLDRVWAGTFRPHEDWRGAAAYVAATVCPGGHIYSNVPADYGYGVGIYAPELLTRLNYLAETSQNEFILDVIKRYPITLDDMIVILRDRPGVFVSGRGTIEVVSNYLGGLHFNYRTFTPRIRVFFPYGGCPA